MATKKTGLGKGLGKGLDSLIPEGKTSRTAITKSKEEPKVVVKEVVKEVEVIKEVPGEGKTMVDITEVEPNREQPRKMFEEDALLELSDSIKQYGILQPLIVQKRNDYYEIIAGERRWRAAKLAGLKQVPVIIEDYTDQEIVEIALIENIQRENLNPIEEAMAYKRLLNEYNLKQDEVAERVSKSRTAVTNSMRLLKLSDRVQQMIVDDMISTGHARALLAIDDEEQQYQLATRIFDEKLSVREIEKLIKSLKNPKKNVVKKPIENAFIYEDMEEKMKRAMGTKVSVNQKSAGKGRIEIEYYSEEEFERLFELITSLSE
ncbi:MAG: ParB/RepB/Spo0J family partition protein [Lachnospiraceae bacterium]|nr:ParB/RepB/Spo0J family partition protein [Lachnospiraceae bacterium]